MDEVEAAQIVDAVDVVGVGVGQKHRVDVRYPLAQHLFAEVRRGVHQDAPAPALDQDGSAGSLVVPVGGIADLTVAADHGNAGRRARAEDGNFHVSDLVMARNVA